MKTYVASSWFNRQNGSPRGRDSPIGPGKRSKHSFQSKTFMVEISFATKIPLSSIALALKGNEVDNTQDALRVLDIVLRQQAANWYLCSYLLFVYVRYYVLSVPVCS